MTIDEAESAFNAARKKWLESAIAQPQKADEEEMWSQYSSAFDDFCRACFNRENWKKPEYEHSAAHNDGETVEGLGDALDA